MFLLILCDSYLCTWEYSLERGTIESERRPKTDEPECRRAVPRNVGYVGNWLTKADLSGQRRAYQVGMVPVGSCCSRGNVQKRDDLPSPRGERWPLGPSRLSPPLLLLSAAPQGGPPTRLAGVRLACARPSTSPRKRGTTSSSPPSRLTPPPFPVTIF